MRKIYLNTYLYDDEIKKAVECESSENGVDSLDINFIQMPEEGITAEALEEIYKINELIEIAKSGVVVPIAFCDGEHWVALSIVPNPEVESRVSVVYINSVNQYGDGLGSYKDTGKKIATFIADAIGSDGYIDCSMDQQYNNCCGLSAAINLVAVAKHFGSDGKVEDLQRSLWAPQNYQEKMDRYSQILDKVNAENLKSAPQQQAEFSERLSDYNMTSIYKERSEFHIISILQVILQLIYDAFMLLFNKTRFIDEIASKENERLKEKPGPSVPLRVKS